MGKVRFTDLAASVFIEANNAMETAELCLGGQLSTYPR